MFPLAKLYNLEGSNSDHSPICLVLKKCEENRCNKRFRFKNAWLLEPMCHQLVEGSWQENSNHDIQTKMKMCSEKLEVWGREITDDFASNIKACKAELRCLRDKEDSHSVTKYEEVKKRLHLILDQRDIFWRQHSKQLWLQSGDKNSKYFHMSASSRKRANQITKLRNAAWEWKEWNVGLEELIVDYYADLYSASQVEWMEVTECVTNFITAEQNLGLLKEVTGDEVKEALFQMHPDKAPGPDGMTPAFFQKHWSTVGKDVVLMVKNFFTDGVLPMELNNTNVVLILKKRSPTEITDLRQYLCATSW